jgi:2-dehydro-3-deoxyphosphogalactonate aldolase
LQSIALLSKTFDDQLLVGAGTVLSSQQVESVAATGAQLIVSPNADSEVIVTAKRLGLISVPGVATPTEALVALNAGADAVKAFPAEMLGADVIKSWQAVLPKTLPVIPVGSIESSNMPSYWKGGASGFGLGGSVYRVGINANEVAVRARDIVTMMKSLKEDCRCPAA